jgi:N utilization substance protein B
MGRSDERRDAVFALYQHEVTDRDLGALTEGLAPFSLELVNGVDGARPTLDDLIATNLEGWELDRIAPLEKNIMRVALFEMRERDDIPVEVAIDEAVELAGRYCGTQAPGLVNGVLGSIAGQTEASK